ncbi:C-X-C motif chemokine ligand 13 [Ictidomys tridecemlineatus]|uniref:C-X-C motif chemokine n=1 Tax=Ictidomys tridecemlineatus TaxID=43179 RepID=I3N7D7_ICTTR|nr:C-X-C motif chemokine 13 [Ictidomys tridecemlineatus]KAG3276373.1 C-X-C motif chemokine ligand 13 [Ictidomys tridecemlineatus]
MRLISAALLLMLLVSSSLSPVHGVLEAYNTNLKCSCVQGTSDFIHVRQIGRLQIIPPGNGCPIKQIIIRLKNKTTVCVNPQTSWIKKLIEHLPKKKLFSTQAPAMKKIG